MSLKKFLGLGKSGEVEDSVDPPESPVDPIAPEDPVLKSSEEVVEEVVEEVQDSDQTALDDTFTSVSIPFVANAPDYTSKLYGANARGYSGSATLGYSNYSSGYSGATTRGYSGATTRGYSGATTSGYSRGYSSPTSVTIPFKANTASYGAPSTTVASSGFSSYSANARGYSSGFSSGFSSPNSVTIPFKANTPSFSAPLSTSMASSYATPATSYVAPMTAPAPVALGGSGAAANFYQNYSQQRDMKLRQTIDNNLTLHA